MGRRERARYFSRAAGSGAFCWIAFFPIADRVAFMRCTARDGLAFFVVVLSLATMAWRSSGVVCGCLNLAMSARKS